MTLPPFILGIDYREIPPREKRNRWRFETLREIVIPLRTHHHRHISFHDATGAHWGTISRKTLIISPHYAWNGCSPKFRAGPLWLGTPDFHRTRLPSLAHDFLYQFSRTHHFPLTRQDTDQLFHHHLRAAHFPLAGLYHAAVREFGAPYWRSHPAFLYSFDTTDNP